MTLKRSVRAWCVLLGTLMIVGSLWIFHANRSVPHQIPVAGYDFAVGFEGSLISAADHPEVKGVEFSSEHARTLQENGSMAWPIVVEGSADPGITLDYLAFFEPFYTDSILGAADIAVFQMDDEQQCSTDLDASIDSANMFAAQRDLNSTDASTPQRHHYCVVAQAPQDASKLEVFTTSNPEQERGVTLNFRHAAN